VVIIIVAAVITGVAHLVVLAAHACCGANCRS